MVAKHLNFTKAAAELRISQPPLSRQIKDLERELGLSLFERNSSSVSLSAPGKYLEAEFRRIMEDIEAARMNARRLVDPATAPLRIACVNSHIATLLPSLLSYAADRLPGQKIDVAMMTSDEQRAALSRGGIDLGVVRSWTDAPAISYAPLISEPFALVFPAAWSKKPAFAGALAELRGQPMAIVSGTAAPGLAAFARSTCEAAGFGPEVAFESTDMNALLKLVAAGLAWSIVPSLSFASGHQPAFRAILMEDITEVGLLWRTDRLSAAAAAFVETAKEYVATRFPGLTADAEERTA